MHTFDEGVVYGQDRDSKFAIVAEHTHTGELEGWLDKQGHFRKAWKRRFFKVTE